jgi:hypothetical protein
MKKVLPYFLLMAGLTPAFGQSTFVLGVKPGLGIQSSYFGLSTGNMTPYIGMDLLGISVKGNAVDNDWDIYSSPYYYEKYQYSEEYSLSGSALLIIPHFGLKFSFSKATPKRRVVPYIFGDFFLCIPSVNAKVKEVDEEWQYNQSGNVIDYSKDEEVWNLQDDEKKLVGDILSVTGLSFGFGADYYFDKRFSLGGEYGFRIFSTSVEYEQNNTDNDDGYYYEEWREEWKGSLSASLRLSYAAVVLSFHF